MSRSSFWLLLLLLLALAAPSSGETPASLRIDGLGKGSVPLDGPWQFHLGDDSTWANPAAEDTTGRNGWEQIAADKSWGAQGHDSYTGFAWYRRHVTIQLAAGVSPDVALFLPRVDDVYEVYWNGLPVGHYGKFPPHPVWYLHPPPQTLGLGEARSGVLAVRVWKAPLASFDSGDLGGFSAPPLIGSPEVIGAFKEASDFRWLRRRQLQFGMGALDCLIGLLALVAWLRDPRQWLLFWMSIYSAGGLVPAVLQTMRFPFHYVVALGLSQFVYGVLNLSTWYLLLLFLRLDEIKPIARILRILAVLEMAAFTVDGCLVFTVPYVTEKSAVYLQQADAVCTAIYTTLTVVPPLLVICAVLRRKQLPAERWFVAICAFVVDLIPSVQSALRQGSRYTHLGAWADKISEPLFSINGNSMNAAALADFILLIATVYAVYRYLQEERERQTAVEQEFKSARELQQVLIPEDLPAIPGYTLTSAYKPASEVGGDFFQIIPLPSRSTLIVLGDVSGKGLKAAMAVSLIVGAIRTFAETTNSPAEILAGLNRRLYGRLQGGFATAIALRLDADGSCVFSSAGHTSPFINDQELHLPGAFPLGLTPDATYEETIFQLHGSEHLALYTDGLLEARNPAGELYSFDRLKTLFATHPTAEQATQAAVAFGQDDDITVLTLTRLADSQPSPVYAPA